MCSKKSIETESKNTESYERLVNRVTEKYDSLSDRNKQVARYLTQNPTSIAMESVNSIAQKCGDLHPSVLVRFAQYFGYSGFKELQKVFQSRLATAAPGFEERVNALENELEKSRSESGVSTHFQDIVIKDIATMQSLLQSISVDLIEASAKQLHQANTIYIIGQLRSEPVANFLRYLFTMLRCPVIHLDPAGGLATQMVRTIGQNDALVAIAFRHYAKETISACEVAQEHGASIIGITDSLLSPVAKYTEQVFCIPEEEYTFSRSLAAPMCIAQALAVSLAALLHPEEDKPKLKLVKDLR